MINLEILSLNVNDHAVAIPFSAISQLTNLKALSIYYWLGATAQEFEFPDSLCNLNQMIHFKMTYVENVESFPMHCIANNWNDLTYFELNVMPYIQTMDQKLWQLPQITSMFFEFTDIDASCFTFDTFEDYSSSLKRVALDGNPRLCNGSIFINNIEYSGFSHLKNSDGNSNFTNDDLDEYKLLQFIKDYDPCYYPCDTDNCMSFYVIFVVACFRVV